MSTNLIRKRNAAVAIAVETTTGTDAIAGSPGGSDWKPGDVEIQFDQNAISVEELSGSLDKGVSIPGGIQSTIRIRTPLRGSGLPGAGPWWNLLMGACAMEATSIAGNVSDPAASGTTTSITFAGGGNITGATQVYRGVPAMISGDQTDLTAVTDWIGNPSRVMTFGSTLVQPTTSTIVTIPQCIKFAPTSDESVYKSVTIYLYADGLLWRFTGAMGTWSLELTTGGLGFLIFTMRADLVSAPTTVALPSAALGISRPTPPRFVAGKLRLNRQVAQTRSLVVNSGVKILLPDDPEAVEGAGPALPTERLVSGTLDPYMNTSLSPARFAAFQAGAEVPLFAIIGSQVGNRFVLTLPSVRKVAMNPADRDGLGVDAIAFEASGANSSVFLTQF